MLLLKYVFLLITIVLYRSQLNLSPIVELLHHFAYTGLVLYVSILYGYRCIAEPGDSSVSMNLSDVMSALMYNTAIHSVLYYIMWSTVCAY